MSKHAVLTRRTGRSSTATAGTHTGQTRNRFIIHEVESDYMRPAFEPGDRIEIDTSVTRARHDGYYLIAFPTGRAALRRIAVMIFTNKLKVYCPRDAGSPNLEEYDHEDIKILGRARRFFRETWLWSGG